MRRLKNESGKNFIDRYKLQPVLYQEYLGVSRNHSDYSSVVSGAVASLKSRGWEGQYWQWTALDDRIVKVLEGLESKDFEVIQFVRHHLKFQIKYKSNRYNTQHALLMEINYAINQEVAEIKFSTPNTVWIRLREKV